jgi:hypothetical protein
MSEKGRRTLFPFYQGDQIGRMLAYWAIAFFGRLFSLGGFWTITKVAQIIWPCMYVFPL